MTNTNTAAARVATDSDDALMAREVHESQDDSLLLCASDLQHSAIYDNHIEMQSCIRAVADRITALASVIEGVERAALAAPAQAVPQGWFDCEVEPRPLEYSLRDYHLAPGEGPLHFIWQDKPHRIVYDLIAAVRYYVAAGVTVALAQAGEYPELPEPAMFDAVDRQGNPVSHGYGASQVLALIDADRAARGQTLRLLTQEETDSLGRRAEGMDGNEWDQWVQEKFAQVNGLKVQGGSYEWDWE